MIRVIFLGHKAFGGLVELFVLGYEEALLTTVTS